MKRMIASLALVGLTALAFGQDAPKPAPALVFSGYVDTGVTVLANGIDKASLGLWGDDAGVNGGRFKLIGKYDNGDFGLSFETRWDGLINNTATGPVYFKHVYAQSQFFDKKVLSQAGVVKEESTKTGGNKNYKYASEVPGAVVVLKPVPELAIQAFIAPAVGQAAITSSEQVANAFDTQSAFSAAYTATGLARVAAGVYLFNSKNNNYAVSKAYAGVNLYAVPNLSATVEGAVENLNDGSSLNQTSTVVETLSYNFKDLGSAPLTVGLIAYQIVYGDDIKTKDGAKNIAQNMSLRIQPSVSYAFDGFVTGTLGLAYQSGAVVLTDGYTNDLGKTVGVPTASTAKSTNINKNNLATFEIKPSVKLTLSKTQSLSFIYAYSTSIGADDVLYLNTNKDSKSMHTLQTAYTYSF